MRRRNPKDYNSKNAIFFLHLQKLEIFIFYVGTSKILDPAAKRLRGAVKVGQLFSPRHSCENLVSYCSLLALPKTPLNAKPKDYNRAISHLPLTNRHQLKILKNYNLWPN